MIEVRGLDGAGTLASVGACLRTVWRAEADQLALAAHWADLHDPAGSTPAASEVEARRRRLDGDYLERRFLQLDHLTPYLSPDRGGPPGQTGPEHLNPLAGPEHQTKTSRRWQVRSPAAGVCLWRSPHGFIHLVTNQGAHELGSDPRAAAIWHACAPANAVLVA